jgi:ribosome-binding protein aMBF1 (putative translation factor)
MADLHKVLGNRIRNARNRLSLSQAQLAEEIGFSASQIISQIEKGERDVSVAQHRRTQTRRPRVVAKISRNRQGAN